MQLATTIKVALMIICLLAIVGSACRKKSQFFSRTRRSSSVTCTEPAKKLFGTKTLYEDARKFLANSDEDDLPESFSSKSLEQEHKKLANDGCKAIFLYFVGRHSARFPDGEDISQYNKNMRELINALHSTNKACQNMRQKFHNWQSKMVPEQDNLITELGGLEEKDIARRFKMLYPDFFDAKLTNVSIGVTPKIRTAQTASFFLQEVEGLNLESCKLTPTNDIDRSDYNLQSVLNAPCYKDLTRNYNTEFLEFHKQCETISGEVKDKHQLVERVKSPQVIRPISNRVAKKLGLEESFISPDMLDSIYNTCKFETALRGSSIWCTVFEMRDIEALEYIEDVSSYFKGAYGPRANPAQSCPLVSHFINELDRTISRARSGSSEAQAYFYFSHASPIKKLLATFGLFRDENNYSEKAIAEFESRLKVPKRREWRTSIESPFSANLALMLYQCPASSPKDKFKVLAAVTEKPVKLRGCKDTRCEVQQLFRTYDSMRDCDLNRVCAKT